ncbi:signal peptidase I [Streptomyces jumonjinensis]|uniref:signal peptidase I n=1 Tax=Streptomyces jumonjinensis TaxID=1945 RepID=UPI0037AAF337
MESEREEDGRGRLGSTLSGLAVAVGSVLFLGGFGWGALVYQPYTVPTDSMSPTVAAGERVLAQRLDGDRVRRGDVVVFRDADWGGSPMIKRVVGVGGDTVACCGDGDGDGGGLTVNGESVEEPYLSGRGPASPDAFTAKVPEGRIFLLGDERMGSLDSRTHLKDPGQGAVPRSAVVGRLDAIAWPLSGGVIERPESFAALPGGISEVGPVRWMAASIAAGAALILGGAAYGPLARLLGRRGAGRGRAVVDAGS